MDVAITEMRVTQGDRVVMLRREESSSVGMDTVAVHWKLTDGTITIGVVPDDVDQAKALASTYLGRMAEADDLRAKADTIEQAVLQDVRQPSEALYMTAEPTP